MLRKYKITYKMVLKERETVLEASSKYDAKKRFYRLHPKWEIVKVEVIEGSEDEQMQ